MKKSAEEWAEHVTEWRRSGETAVEYSERRGLKVTSLRYWSSRLRREAKENHGAGSGAVSPAGTNVETLVKMARVVRVAAPASALPSVAIAMGAFRVEVGAEFDAVVLNRVLDVLTSRSGGAQ